MAGDPGGHLRIAGMGGGNVEERFTPFDSKLFGQTALAAAGAATDVDNFRHNKKPRLLKERRGHEKMMEPGASPAEELLKHSTRQVS
jgi:hypothetical protein